MHDASRQHKGWSYRGYLPHFDRGAIIQSITFRLADSLPKPVYDELAAAAGDDIDLRMQVEAMIDSGRGACDLARPEIATIVRDALRRFDGERYRLIAWVIMPNHVHVLIEQLDGFRLSDVVHSWKSFTAKAANKARGATGHFWAPDYFDRFIRDEAHFHNVVAYIHDNPVKAGLSATAKDWRWSSAEEEARETRAVPAP